MTNTKRILVVIGVIVWCLLSLPLAQAQDLFPKRCGDILLASNTVIIQKKGGSGGGGGGASCTTASDSKLDSYVGTTGGAFTEDKIGAKFTLAAETTITEYNINACDAGADAGTLTVCLYADDGGGATSLPTGSCIAGTDATVNASALPNCETYTATTFTLGTPKSGIAAGTYWIVRDENSSAVKSGYNTPAAGRRTAYTDGGAWTGLDNFLMGYEVWGCQP